MYLAWYPIKAAKPVDDWLYRALSAIPGSRLLRIELMLRRPLNPDRLNGCGLVVANPPHTLHGALAGILPELTRRLGDGKGVHFRIEPLG